MKTPNEYCDPGLRTRDEANLKSFRAFALPWAISLSATHLLLPRSDDSLATQPMWAWLLVAVVIVLGALMTRSYLRFIRGADELMQKVHLEALAAGFGVAFVFGMGAGALEQLGIPKVAALTWGLMVLAYVWKLNRTKRKLRA